MLSRSTKYNKRLARYDMDLTRDMIVVAVIWTLIVSMSLCWTIYMQHTTTRELALIQAQAGFERDQLFRKWGALHGGTYVPITKATQPNPHLVVPEREIETPSGRDLTLLNPVYMMRQVHELGEESGSIKGHLTSLKPLRPENGADPWETAALQGFERGETEQVSIRMFRGESHLRLMRPFVVTDECMKCHSHQGYKVGDIRGGISVSVPMEPLQALARSNQNSSIVWHLVFWFVGLIETVRFQKRKNKAIEELATNEQKLAMITDTTGDGVVVMDPAGNAAYWNPAAEAMFGYPSEEIIGKNIHHILTPERYRPAAFKAHGKFLTSGKGAALGKPVELEANRKDGTEFPIEMVLNGIKKEDGWWAIAMIRDITDRKLAEKERERSRETTEKILESMPVGVAIIGRDKVIRHVNSTALAMMGFDSPQDIQGYKCQKTFCNSNECQCPILDLGEEIVSVEKVLIGKGDEEMPILKTVVPINIDGEDVLLETFIDIRERKNAELKLQMAKEEAEAANRTKSQFLASMSHELRTPLTGILGFTDLLLISDFDEAKRRDHLKTVRSSGKHLLGLINDILDLSKIEVGQLSIERVHCSPHEILNNVTSIMRAQAQAKGIELNCSWRGLVPATIETDESRFRQILLNLVGNAVKFTSRGAVDVVAYFEPAGDGHRLSVDITDSGIGIPQEKLESIFEPFVQADNSVTREFGGTGLGLAISVPLTKALGGEISVSSEMGVGSKFTVSVDAGDMAEVEMLSAPPADGVQAGQDNLLTSNMEHLRSAKVLLVEDGVVNRKLISTVLEMANLEVSLAENGQIGVEMATSHDYDLILMDMQMPVLDGYAATRKLRSLGYELPIVALTAHAMKGDMEKCLATGCSHYISKPIVIKKLLAVVADALEKDGDPEGEQNLEKSHCKDFEPLVSTLPTDDPVFREIVENFTEYLDRTLSGLCEAAAGRDAVKLNELAHSLKGTAGTAGFDSFTEPAQKLEALAGQGQLDETDLIIAELKKMAGRIHFPTGTCKTS